MSDGAEVATCAHKMLRMLPAEHAKVGGRTATYHSGLAKALDPSRVQAWRGSLSPVDQAVAHEIAGNALELFGYPPGITSHPLKFPASPGIA